MRRFSSIAAPLLVALSLIIGSGVASEPATAGDPFRAGAPITVKKPVRIQKLAKHPAKFEGKVLRLEGTVKNVCQGRGCWVDVEDANGVTFMAKSLDETVLLPKDCAGRKVIVQGIVTALAHEHDAAKEEGHACPTPRYVLATQGVELIAERK